MRDEMRRLTEDWDGVRCRRQRLTDYQQKHDESQQDCDLQVDFLAGLDRQEKA